MDVKSNAKTSVMGVNISKYILAEFVVYTIPEAKPSFITYNHTNEYNYLCGAVLRIATLHNTRIVRGNAKFSEGYISNQLIAFLYSNSTNRF